MKLVSSGTKHSICEGKPRLKEQNGILFGPSLALLNSENGNFKFSYESSASNSKLHVERLHEAGQSDKKPESFSNWIEWKGITSEILYPKSDDHTNWIIFIVEFDCRKDRPLWHQRQWTRRWCEGNGQVNFRLGNGNDLRGDCRGLPQIKNGNLTTGKSNNHVINTAGMEWTWPRSRGSFSFEGHCCSTLLKVSRNHPNRKSEQSIPVRTRGNGPDGSFMQGNNSEPLASHKLTLTIPPSCSLSDRLTRKIP